MPHGVTPTVPRCGICKVEGADTRWLTAVQHSAPHGATRRDPLCPTASTCPMAQVNPNLPHGAPQPQPAPWRNSMCPTALHNLTHSATQPPPAPPRSHGHTWGETPPGADAGLGRESRALEGGGAAVVTHTCGAEFGDPPLEPNDSQGCGLSRCRCQCLPHAVLSSMPHHLLNVPPSPHVPPSLHRGPGGMDIL